MTNNNIIILNKNLEGIKMKKELEKRIEEYCNSTEFPWAVYFSNVVPDARYTRYKYFFKYYNTHTVAEAFKTQKEIEKFLDIQGALSPG